MTLHLYRSGMPRRLSAGWLFATEKNEFYSIWYVVNIMKATIGSRGMFIALFQEAQEQCSRLERGEKYKGLTDDQIYDYRETLRRIGYLRWPRMLRYLLFRAHRRLVAERLGVVRRRLGQWRYASNAGVPTGGPGIT